MIYTYIHTYEFKCEPAGDTDPSHKWCHWAPFQFHFEFWKRTSLRLNPKSWSECRIDKEITYQALCIAFFSQMFHVQCASGCFVSWENLNTFLKLVLKRQLHYSEGSSHLQSCSSMIKVYDTIMWISFQISLNVWKIDHLCSGYYCNWSLEQLFLSMLTIESPSDETSNACSGFLQVAVTFFLSVE